MTHRPAYQSIQCLRGIAALLVVLFHLRIVESKYGQGEALLPGLARFADAGVDLFFVISGFVISIVAVGLYRSPANAARFLTRRTWRVAPPYWVYTTLVVVLMSVAPTMVNMSYGEQSIWASYLFWPHRQLPVLTVGWTLIHEMYFYLVTAATIAFVQVRYRPMFLIGWALLVLTVYFTRNGSSAPWVEVASSPMTLEFICGALIGLYGRQLPVAAARACVLLGASGFVLGMLVLDNVGLQQNTPMQRTLVFGSTSAMLVLGATSLERLRPMRPSRWLTAIGDSSYSLYLSHVFVISAAGRVWSMTRFNETSWQHAVFVALAVVACVLVGHLSYLWLERPLLAASRNLVPKRPTLDMQNA